MLELLGSLIGAGGTIAGGIVGANAQSDANDSNWKINLLNYYLRERERQDRIRQAAIERHDRQLGATNASGSRVYFKPGVGWVEELSAQDKGMQDAQNKEQEARLMVDLPARRKKMQQDLASQGNDAYYAEGAMDAYKRSGELPQYAGARAATAAAQGVNQNWDNIVNALMRNANRTGNSNTGMMLNQLMQGRTADANSVIARARLGGEAQGDQAGANRGANYLNIADSFIKRSRGMPSVAYTPQNIQGNTDKLLTSNQQLAADAGNQLTQAYGQKGGSMDYVEPQYGWANTIASGGQALGSSLSNMGSYFAKRQAQGSGSDF